jgi:hypothetical protein
VRFSWLRRRSWTVIQENNIGRLGVRSRPASRREVSISPSGFKAAATELVMASTAKQQASAAGCAGIVDATAAGVRRSRHSPSAAGKPH